ncbi:hypothetical protein [Propioniciclava soli]|uniref:Uncharacterized protein n=1 Tax=Propioniciclava soli TaxID=2775081 RepID=A0ABZ3C382_9ACTN|nr:hypothetical protein [Propioniciclava soli]
MTLLETAAHAADHTEPIIIALVAFGILLTLMAITVGYGSGRPHTQ